MTSASASARSDRNNSSDAENTADSILKKYSTPLTAATAIVVCVTGVMMFFHLYKGEVQAMHEWLGMGFVVAAGLHLLRHRRPLVLMMKHGRTHVLLVLTLVISLAFLYPSGDGKQGSPIRPMVNAVLRAPIKDLAPVIGISDSEMTVRLTEAGIQNAAPTSSLETLARSAGTEPMRLLTSVMSPATEKD